MATRATYEIGGMFFYTHYDGHQTGAAARFARMIEAWNVPTTGDAPFASEHPKGGLSFAFIRGNLDVEPAKNHQDHGDTQYRYTVKLLDNGLIELWEAVRARSDYVRWHKPRMFELSHWMVLMQVRHRDQLAWHWKTHPEEAPQEVKDGNITAEHLASQDAAEDVPLIVQAEHQHLVRGQTVYAYATLENAARIKHRHAALVRRYHEDNPNRLLEQQGMRNWGRGIKAAINEGRDRGLLVPAPPAERAPEDLDD